MWNSSVVARGGGGGTPIHKLYGDVPPFRVWFFERPLINRVSNSKIFKDFFINRIWKSCIVMKKWVEFDLKIINRVSIFQDFFYHKQGQSFKARAAPPYPNLGQVPPPRELLLLLQFRLTLSQPLMLNYNVCVVKIAFSLSSTQDLNCRLVLSLKRLYPTIYCGMSGPAELLWKWGGGGGGWIVTQSGGGAENAFFSVTV